MDPVLEITQVDEELFASKRKQTMEDIPVQVQQFLRDNQEVPEGNLQVLPEEENAEDGLVVDGGVASNGTNGGSAKIIEECDLVSRA